METPGRVSWVWFVRRHVALSVAPSVSPPQRRFLQRLVDWYQWDECGVPQGLSGYHWHPGGKERSYWTDTTRLCWTNEKRVCLICFHWYSKGTYSNFASLKVMTFGRFHSCVNEGRRLLNFQPSFLFSCLRGLTGRPLWSSQPPDCLFSLWLKRFLDQISRCVPAPCDPHLNTQNRSVSFLGWTYSHSNNVCSFVVVECWMVVSGSP